MWMKSLWHDRIHYIVDEKAICNGAYWIASVPAQGYENQCPQCVRRLNIDAQAIAARQAAQADRSDSPSEVGTT